MSFTNFPAAIQNIVQQGFLEREFQEGLDSVLAYRRECLQESIPARIGQTLTKTRTGRFVPTDTPIDPTTNTGLDNGLTPDQFSIEQYSFNISQYAKTTDVDLMQDEVALANTFFTRSRNQGVQAAQSMERICRKKLFQAYLGGNTRVRTDLGAGSTTTCFVDDITGFTSVLVNGTPTGISSANPLVVTETSTGAGVTQTLSVTAATAEATNHSTTPGGVSGFLTFAAATLPVNGDAIVATNAAKIIRPFNRATTAFIKSSDILTLGLCLDAASYLKDNAVPPMEDGNYHLILDNTSMRQLFADQQFQIAYAGRYQSKEYQDGDIVQLLGITFIPTTETIVQQGGRQASGAAPGPYSWNPGAASTATGTAQTNVRIRRPLMMGAESIIQGNFDGVAEWLNRQGVDPINGVWLVNEVAHIVRPPLDRLAQTCSLSWQWIGDFSVPTDITATTDIIPTASNALYKRCLVLETAG